MPIEFPKLANEPLRSTLIDLLFEQQMKVARMAFLAPDVAHVFRVAANAQRLAESALFAAAGGRDFSKRAVVAAFLSKLGFAHPDLQPEDAGSLFRNRLFALELLGPLRPAIQHELSLSEADYRQFVEAILRQGTFGLGTRDDPDLLRVELASDVRFAAALQSHSIAPGNLSAAKYANPLTALLTLASEIDVGQARLQDWQRDESIMKALLGISGDPALATLEIERFAIEARGRHEPSTGSADTRRQLTENRSRLKDEIGRLVRREFVEPEAEIKRRMRASGLPAERVDALYQRAAACIAGINSESYLWYVASNGIASIEVSDDARTFTIRQTDHADTFGAAAALPHIRDFHVDRLANLIGHVNVALGCDLRLERHEVKRDQHLWDSCQNLFKGDTHMHLKMSVMASRIWESLIGPQLDVYEQVFDESQHLLNRLRRKRNLPANIDLKQMFAEANSRANALFGFTRRYRSDYRWPEIKDELTSEALSTAASFRDRMAAGEHDVLDDDIRLYYLLKFHVTKLFSFSDGALPDFVDHFTAVSKLLSKVSVVDESATLKALTHSLLIDASRHGVWYVEPRFNIGKAFAGTLREVLLVIQAYKELQAANPGLPVPLMKIVLSITKFDDQAKPIADRVAHKEGSADIFVRILEDAGVRATSGNHPYDGLSGLQVTPRDVLNYVGGFDAAGQEEFNPPELFFTAFHRVAAYNRELGRAEHRLGIPPVGFTFHISESITDVSIESGIRHLFEALWMKPFPDVTEGEPVLLTRVGHAIVVALSNYDLFLGVVSRESIDERLRQIAFDRKLCQMGVPLLAVAEPDLDAEDRDLTRYLSAPPGEQAGIAARWGIDTDGTVGYRYDEPQVIDLRTRAGLARDCLIRHGVVVETNPTSNVGVSPYVDRYEEHPLRTYSTYQCFDWARDRQLIDVLQVRSAGADRAQAARARGQLQDLERFQRQAIAHHGQTARVTINTDDGTLFGITLVDEYYRTAMALNLTAAQLQRLADDSFATAIQPLPDEQVASLRRRVAGQRVVLRPPKSSVGGLNELIVRQLKACADELDLSPLDPPVVTEGAPEDGFFYLVLAGSVLVHFRGQQVAVLRSNESFGEMAKPGGRRTATVAAGPDGVRVLKIDKAPFLRLCLTNRTVRQYFEDLILSRDPSKPSIDFDAHFAMAAEPADVGVNGV